MLKIWATASDISELLAQNYRNRGSFFRKFFIDLGWFG